MKAMLCKGFGPPDCLVLEDVPSKALGAGQVRLAVHAAGVNRADLSLIAGSNQYKPPFPFAPGTEVAGEVIEVGADVSSPRVGERVLATLTIGGFATEAVAAARNCFVLPARMDFVIAAGLPMTYGVSYYALVQRGGLKAGDVLLVNGATGGVGTATLDIGRNLGARIIATGSNDEKLERVANTYGVEHVFNYRTQPQWKDKVKELTLAQGANVILDVVGGEVLENSMRCVAWDGRVLVVGFASGEIPQISANIVLLKSSALVGVFWGAWLAREPEANRTNFETLFRWYNEGKLKPLVSHTFPLAQAKDALQALEQRQVTGKCVITTGR